MSEDLDFSKFGDADFEPLGDMEIERARDIFQQCEFLRRRASSSGLIIAQWATDVEWALKSIPVVAPSNHGILADNPARRARRVARHGHRMAEAMRTIAVSASKMPPAYMKAYSDVIQNRRGKGRVFDPKDL